MNQDLFTHGCPSNSNAIIQIKPPSEEQIVVAKERMGEALRLAEPPPRPPRVSKAAASRAEGLRELNA